VVQGRWREIDDGVRGTREAFVRGGGCMPLCPNQVPVIKLKSDKCGKSRGHPEHGGKLRFKKAVSTEEGGSAPGVTWVRS